MTSLEDKVAEVEARARQVAKSVDKVADEPLRREIFDRVEGLANAPGIGQAVVSFGDDTVPDTIEGLAE